MELTQEEIDALTAWMRQADVGSMAVERPVVRSMAMVESGMEVGIGADVRLSESTRKRQERRAQKERAKTKAVAARAAKLPRGRFSHKKKAATRKRAANERWRVQPLQCLCYGYGVWNISQEDWDRTVGPLWGRYDPLKLTVKRRWGYGTKDKPYTIHDINVVHKTKGVLYVGQDQLVLDYSMPNALDLSAAPEGAELFCIV